MTQVLKQSTAVDVLIGPFVDLTDGATAETGESPSVKLSKNGQTLAAKSDVTTPLHDADGYYNCELDATDTNTVGTLILTVAASANALPVRHEFQVVEEAIYDALFAASAAGFDANQRVSVGAFLSTLDLTTTMKASVNTEADTALTDYDPPTNAELVSEINSVQTDIAALNDLDAAGIRTAVGLASANLDTQLADLPTVAEFEARTIAAADYFDPAADTVTVGTNNDKTGYSLANDARPTKNVALSNLVFTMVDATDFATPETGLTITAQISKDGGAFAACTNSAAEIANGAYKINLTQTEMNADTILLRFTGTGAAARMISIYTQPAL